jgi:hypothetical protein
VGHVGPMGPVGHVGHVGPMGPVGHVGHVGPVGPVGPVGHYNIRIYGSSGLETNRLEKGTCSQQSCRYKSYTYDGLVLVMDGRR